MDEIDGVDFSKNGIYNVKAKGDLTIHGVTKRVAIPGTITVKGNDATLNAKFNVKTADYKINIPKITEGKIANEIEVTVNSILSKK